MARLILPQLAIRKLSRGHHVVGNWHLIKAGYEDIGDWYENVPVGCKTKIIVGQHGDPQPLDSPFIAWEKMCPQCLGALNWEHDV